MNAATSFARDNMYKIALLAVSIGIMGWFAYQVGFIDFLLNMVIFGAMMVPIMMLVFNMMSADEYNATQQAMDDLKNEILEEVEKGVQEKFNALWRVTLEKDKAKAEKSE